MRYVWDEELQEVVEVMGVVTREEIVEEIEHDLEALEEYDRVYDAANPQTEPEAPAEPEKPAADVPTENAPADGTDTNVGDTNVPDKAPAEPEAPAPTKVPVIDPTKDPIAEPAVAKVAPAEPAAPANPEANMTQLPPSTPPVVPAPGTEASPAAATASDDEFGDLPTPDNAPADAKAGTTDEFGDTAPTREFE